MKRTKALIITMTLFALMPVLCGSDTETTKLKDRIKRQQDMIERLKKEVIKEREKNKNLQNTVERLTIETGSQSSNLGNFEILKDNFDGLEVGKIAYIKDAKILQVIDKNNFRAEIKAGVRYEWQHRYDKRLEFDKAIPILKDVWITGIDASKLADDEKININVPFEIIGTKTYPTAIGGTQTVYQLAPVDWSKYKIIAFK